jgi:hypothetical protein
MVQLNDFKEIWSHDFEYKAALGERVQVHCLVAHELRSGQRVRLWRDHLSVPPYRMDSDCLFVSFNAAAELSSHLSLGWPLPLRILDLAQEFKCLTNGCALPDGRGLLGAMSFYHLDAISVAEKDDMRELAMRGAPFTEQEKKDLIAYCETDVIALEKLLGRMWDKINLPQALHRGRYMRALATVEYNGTPIDVETLTSLRRYWEPIKLDLIADVNREFRCFEGTSFRLNLFARWLREHGIRNWPRTDVGRLSKSDDTFKAMARVYPQLQPLRELNYAISKMRLEKFAVGLDARNRTSLWAFSTKTSRNAPGATEYIFGPSVYLRSLIKPPEGFGVVYIDYSAQEFATAAVLSGDEEMIRGYQSGDPYLAFGKSAGAIPSTATKKTHGKERDKYKLCLLGILYGMGPQGLALYSGQTEEVARDILKSHKRVYKRFWAWRDEVLEQALLKGRIRTRYGWQFSAPWKSTKPDKKKKSRTGVPIRTLINFPVQSNAAEMFRLGVCLMTERGVKTCALVHDAVLIEAPITSMDRATDTAREAMIEASLAVLDNRLALRVDAKPVRYPERYFDERGRSMWDTVMRALKGRMEAEQFSPQAPQPQQMELGLWV